MTFPPPPAPRGMKSRLRLVRIAPAVADPVALAGPGAGRGLALPRFADLEWLWSPEFVQDEQPDAEALP